MQKLLTVQEAADILGVKKGTIYYWVHRKKIEHVKVGRLVKFTPEAIEKFIKERTVTKGRNPLIIGHFEDI